MGPLLRTNIRLRRNKIGKLGLPGKCTALLFADHIVFSDKSNTDIENVLISEIAKAALAKGVIVIRLKDDETRSLYFDTVSQKVGTRFIFGLVGGFLSMNASKNIASANAWIEQLQKLEVDTVKV